MLTEQEFREVVPIIKFGNAGIHVTGEISKDRLHRECSQVINSGIRFVNNVTSTYINKLMEKGYGSIVLEKTGFSVPQGNFYECIARESARKNLIHRVDIEEFQQD